MAIELKQFGKEYRPNKGKSYFTMAAGKEPVPVTHVEKNKACQLYWYCVQKPDLSWLAFDVRELPNFDISEFEAVKFWLMKRFYVADYLQNQNIQGFSFFSCG